jgi:methylmalonyl-CoA carboxyltransferase 12S subunit
MSEGDPEVREDLAELIRRRRLTEDAARPEAIDRRHAHSYDYTVLAGTQPS